MDTAPSLDQLVLQARELFREQYGADARWTVAAPGRVNLIGEHTDYNDGYVCPMAIERYVVIAAGRAEGRDAGVRFFTALSQEETTLRPGEQETIDLPKWAVYPYGVLDLLRKRGMMLGAIDAVVVSTVPLGGGLSSSAALEVATATLAEAVSGQPLDGRDKARLCQMAENHYVGMPCGIMDQFSSALCSAGEAMRLDCRSLEIHPVPLADPAVSVLVTNSNVKHELTGSEYPTRRKQCEQAATALGVPMLRDATIELLEAKRDSMEDVIYRRARHIIGENQRVIDFSAAAAVGDWAKAGELMYASHAAMRDDFEISCPEIDALVEIARGIGPAGGVYGSRMTGGGFGGCTVTLVETAKVDAVVKRLLDEYRQQTGAEGAAFVTRPAGGAHAIK
ncbi:Galactokinase [Pirellulimonas nuda]|uniref:Galactokinase n=1 Tax=Pirellulimonas nuda TaxID=2528009 RepID=A0A518D7P8_9BACT|nr:galactokinase [Pirellulimonas nuda]QDU87476.1 Galactokinase [Pirellulimonas nuda]